MEEDWFGLRNGEDTGPLSFLFRLSSTLLFVSVVPFVLTDRTFHNFGASRSGDPRNLCSLGRRATDFEATQL